MAKWQQAQARSRGAATSQLQPRKLSGECLRQLEAGREKHHIKAVLEVLASGQHSQDISRFTVLVVDTLIVQKLYSSSPAVTQQVLDPGSLCKARSHVAFSDQQVRELVFR